MCGAIEKQLRPAGKSTRRPPRHRILSSADGGLQISSSIFVASVSQSRDFLFSRLDATRTRSMSASERSNPYAGWANCSKRSRLSWLRLFASSRIASCRAWTLEFCLPLWDSRTSSSCFSPHIVRAGLTPPRAVTGQLRSISSSSSSETHHPRHLRKRRELAASSMPVCSVSSIAKAALTSLAPVQAMETRTPLGAGAPFEDLSISWRICRACFFLDEDAFPGESAGSLPPDLSI
mmetsp:Transcript_51021/g.143616  ORF Transcript_51021/g.143616 Transcript_51021/m.143616 type:complete len:235 (-) Transcript_51021:106-810(-)